LETGHTETSEFIFPPGTRYQCVGCGYCCRQRWGVEVEKECLDNLPDDLKRSVGPPQKQDEKTNIGGVIVPGESHAGCPLLDTDNLCVIHKRLGYDAKPLVCREFPFRFVETPRGVIVDVSYVCNEVLHQRGNDIEQYRPELEKLYAKTARKVSVGDKVLLKSRTSITYDAYLLIEQTLLRILSDQRHTVEDRLVAGNVFLYSLTKNIYDDEKIVLSQEPIQKRLEKFAPKHISRLYEIAKKSEKMSSRHRQQVFVVTFLTFASSASEKRGKVNVLLRTWVNNIKLTFNVGKIRIPVLSAPVPIRRLCDMEFDPEDRDINDLAERYMTHCIFRKTLVSEYGLFRGYNVLLLIYGVTKWLSKVFALQAGRDKVRPADFADAIQLVERQYVRHNEHLALLRVESRAMRFVDRLFDDLGFAPIIVKS